MATIEDYLQLVPAQHADKPNYIATLTVVLQPIVDAINLLEALNAKFDIDVAVGQQLDFVGQWVGLTRVIDTGFTPPTPQPVWFGWGVAGAGWNQGAWFNSLSIQTPPDDDAIPYFSWATPTMGWGQAPWVGTSSPSTGVVVLDDDHYRLLLKARIVANQWDGTVANAYEAWNTLFAPEQIEVLIQNVALSGPYWFSWGIDKQGWPSGTKKAMFAWGDAANGWGEAAWHPPGTPTYDYANDGGVWFNWSFMNVPFQWGVYGAGWGEGKWSNAFDQPIFSWGVAGAGWNQAFWDPGPPSPIPLDFGAMRILEALLVPAGKKLDPLTVALFEGGYLNLKPAGVHIDAFVTQTVAGQPLFAWGAGPSTPPPPPNVFQWGVGGYGWGQQPWHPPGTPTYPADISDEFPYPPTPLGGWGIGCWGKFAQGAAPHAQQ